MKKIKLFAVAALMALSVGLSQPQRASADPLSAYTSRVATDRASQIANDSGTSTPATDISSSVTTSVDAAKAELYALLPVLFGGMIVFALAAFAWRKVKSVAKGS